ncbi:MAG: carbohydrate kinase family protein [Acidobacteriia bacterium]|nr:carbohydrate kinase family protein [Terriglobia bacterium]
MPDAARGVLCAGNLVLDILVHPVSGIRWDTTTWVESIRQSLGGNGGNTSYALARLGTFVRLTGMVGRDSFADFVLAQLEQAGVETSAISRCAEPTATTVGLVNPEGARTFLHQPGASKVAFEIPIEFNSGLIAGCSHFHLANIYGLPHMRVHAEETLRRARRAGLTTSLDTGWDFRGEWLRVAAPCLPHLDFLFANEEEARLLTGREDHAEAAAHLRSLGASTVVVKLGSRGCALYSAKQALTIPGYAVHAVDSTGAGDCFAGGFLDAWLDGASHEDAARFANANGALSVQSLGAVTGLLSRQETVDWMRRQSL